MTETTEIIAGMTMRTKIMAEIIIGGAAEIRVRIIEGMTEITEIVTRMTELMALITEKTQIMTIRTEMTDITTDATNKDCRND